jgi:hypothetical protein
MRDGIVPALMKGVAATEAFEAQPHTFGRTVRADGFGHVVRAGGVVTAGRGQQGRDHMFVPAEEQEEGGGDGAAVVTGSRVKYLFTSACRSVNTQSSTFRRGLKTIDHSELSAASSSRTASRSRRLIRLRTTALPRARGAVKPTRGPGGRAGSGRLKTAKRGHV